MYKLEAVSIIQDLSKLNRILISFIIIGIRGSTAKDAENPKMQIPSNIIQMFSSNPQKFDGPISIKPTDINSFPIQSKSLISNPLSITFTTIIAEKIGKTNGNAKNSPYNDLSTCISESLLDNIAGAKFSKLISIIANTSHFKIAYILKLSTPQK